MSAFQYAATMFCFWPILAIGFPFICFLWDERLLRFRLRALMFAMTVAAVMLGVVAYVVRQ